jgi:hypothetical protein
VYFLSESSRVIGESLKWWSGRPEVRTSSEGL